MSREQYEVYAIGIAPALKRAATRLAFPDHALAEDLVQCALIRGYQMMLAGRFEVTGGALSWFIRGITGDFLAHRRKHHRCDVVPSDSDIFQDVRCGDTPESLLVSEVISDKLSLALSQLPTEQRDCIELVDLAELSYLEAARILKVPVGTVRSRLSRARLFVASKLGEQE